MKQTQTHTWSLAGEKAVAYSLARGKAAAVTRESGEVAACSLARERRRQQSLSLQPEEDEEHGNSLKIEITCITPVLQACIVSYIVHVG